MTTSIIYGGQYSFAEYQVKMRELADTAPTRKTAIGVRMTLALVTAIHEETKSLAETLAGTEEGDHRDIICSAMISSFVSASMTFASMNVKHGEGKAFGQVVCEKFAEGIAMAMATVDAVVLNDDDPNETSH